MQNTKVKAGRASPLDARGLVTIRCNQLPALADRSRAPGDVYRLFVLNRRGKTVELDGYVNRSDRSTIKVTVPKGSNVSLPDVGAPVTWQIIDMAQVSLTWID